MFTVVSGEGHGRNNNNLFTSDSYPRSDGRGGGAQAKCSKEGGGKDLLVRSLSLSTRGYIPGMKID